MDYDRKGSAGKKILVMNHKGLGAKTASRKVTLTLALREESRASLEIEVEDD
jgi:hypothetical protein